MGDTGASGLPGEPGSSVSSSKLPLEEHVLIHFFICRDISVLLAYQAHRDHLDLQCVVLTAYIRDTRIDPHFGFLTASGFSS